MVIILKLTSRPPLSLLLCRTFLQYLGLTYFVENKRTYVFLHDFTYEIHEKCNLLVGSPAVLVIDEIHFNEYPGTCRVMNVGYPGSKISTRFNPTWQ